VPTPDMVRQNDPDQQKQKQTPAAEGAADRAGEGQGPGPAASRPETPARRGGADPATCRTTNAGEMLPKYLEFMHSRGGYARGAQRSTALLRGVPERATSASPTRRRPPPERRDQPGRHRAAGSCGSDNVSRSARPSPSRPPAPSHHACSLQ
jgi:hypothetical protein